MTAFFIKTRTAIQQRLERGGRPRAYDPPPHPWLFEQILDKVTSAGKEIPNPRKQAAMFVVHGMGTQGYPDTAVVLRDGIEDAIDALLHSNPAADIPPPYTAEGFWANYENFQDQFKDEWRSFDEHERLFFQKLWKSRVQSAFRTYFWLLKELVRLCVKKDIRKKVGFRRWVGYVLMLFTGFLALTVFLLRYPKVLSRVLSDVRVYLRPRGSIEAAIVQRIDRRVGEQFLCLLGLDWNFDPLPEAKRLKIGGKPYTFKYVTWIAHSLGSVISYNAISDLFARCNEFRAEGKKLAAIKKVETALHRFITIGSPLEKIALLFRKALRQWPPPSFTKSFIRSKERKWWTNFFHVWDPVSGILRDEFYEPYVTNFHSKIWRVPFLAHVAYWKDIPILSYILSRTFGRDVVSVEPSFRTPDRVKALQVISWFALLVIYFGVIFGAYLFVTHFWEIVVFLRQLRGA
jgi:hypothetical protein